MKLHFIEWGTYTLSALGGIFMHWLKQWKAVWNTKPEDRPTFKSVIWSSPPDAISSLVGSCISLLIAAASGALTGVNAASLYAAVTSGYVGDSVTDKIK